MGTSPWKITEGAMDLMSKEQIKAFRVWVHGRAAGQASIRSCYLPDWTKLTRQQDLDSEIGLETEAKLLGVEL